ncbi:MAG: MerR family transcriptional regulator [Tannerella sp.]|jgi:DNA-binding transcriptional MerR regulator|nr:MerR family transcriptional regulator [Tannerella sp.]
MENTAASRIYYSIKEVASSLGEAESTLRHWEREFPDVISPNRKGRDIRFYSEKDIESVRLIKYLRRDCGLTSDGVRKKLKNSRERESAARHADIVWRLKNIKAELLLLKEAMDEVERIKGAE